MEQGHPRVTLDDPDLKDRLRYQRRSSVYVQRPVNNYSHLISDVYIGFASKKLPDRPVRKQSPRQVNHSKLSPNMPIVREVTPASPANPGFSKRISLVPKNFFKNLTWKPAMLYCLALLLFVTGIFISVNGWESNQQVAAQVKHLQESGNPSEVTGDDSSVPSTKPITKSVLAAYAVAPDLPKYIDIPSQNVHARVLQVGVNAKGAVETPSNVFDTAWYTGSSKPGQPGAMLIDGHVSSWTTHGVFYGIKNLKKNDIIKITRGDGKVFTYKIVKSRVFSHDKVDMQSAVTPVEEDKPGLNLITCDGDVIPGTNEFDQRIIVYASQV